MRIRDWLDARRQLAIAKAYCRGYDWAAGALLREEVTPADVEAKTYPDWLCLDAKECAFNKGAAAAMDKLCELGTIKDDRFCRED